jgi:hypothetical protein
MVADGKDLRQIDQEIKQMEKAAAKPKPKLDESTATVEYSLMLAGNEEESPKF